MKLHRTPLPSFTTERYYVLSEIEQECEFDFTYQSSEGQPYDSPTVEGQKRFYYTLWDISEGLDALKDSVNKLCSDIKGGNEDERECEEEDDAVFLERAKHFLAIEVLAPRASQQHLESRTSKILDPDTDTNTQQQHEVEQAFKWVLANFADIDFVAFGVCDKLAGTPAIELVQELVCFAYRKVPKERKVLRATRMEHLLGHDESREPDAEADVVQALYTSRCYSRPAVKETQIDFQLLSQLPLTQATVFGLVVAAAGMAFALWLNGVVGANKEIVQSALGVYEL